MRMAYEGRDITSYFHRVEIYNTAEAAYHISPEIYYNLLAVKSCSLSGVRTNFIMELRLLKESISVYKKTETASLRNLSGCGYRLL